MSLLIVPGSASRDFATRLAGELGTRIDAVESKRFPDGEMYVRILEPAAGRDVAIVQSTAPDSALVELLLWLDAAREAKARSVTAIIPYLGYARQDRVFQPGEALSARAAARAIAASSDRVVLVDPHKEGVTSYFDGKAQIVSATPQLAHELGRWGVDAVLAPDAGARARAEQAARLIGVSADHLEKTRLSPTEVRMAAKDLDVAGKRVAIVDDLISSGSTMATAAQQLKAQGAKTVYAACTHGLFADGAVARMHAGGIDRILCTDTWPAAGCDMVSAAPAVARILRG